MVRKRFERMVSLPCYLRQQVELVDANKLWDAERGTERTSERFDEEISNLLRSALPIFLY
ncbi:hypothetical protein MXL46_15965 [Heyndrickxia sporothermodurans]|uniref:hypothetical protein n=1 Tax=Heyndrickxia sporothermodurans TaxID=46224 RepID=UPI002DBAC344|nr:hypothetical protein [Heyndrickxia sporothermodurans]MEB6550564.1 hypothetical protein [Heyndrickxia sporothermodurans]